MSHKARPYRISISLIALIALSTISLTAAPAKNQSRYYPQRDARAPKASSPPGVSIVNAASFLPGISPGSLATIFGADISVSGIVVANRNPLPRELAGVEVIVNGVAAPIFAVTNTNGQSQINFQVPWETDTGPDAAEIEVLDFGDTVARIQTESFTADPGIFTTEGYALAVRAADWSLIRPGDAARPGAAIIIYATGLGPVSL